MYRRQYLDVPTQMSHRCLYPSRAKSEPTRHAISPPPSAKLARMVLLSTLFVKAENCQSPILFQSMPLLFCESLKTCLKQALSNPPNLVSEPLQQAGEAWAAPTKHSGSHLKPWSPSFADAQAVDGRWLNAGAGSGRDLPDSRPAAPSSAPGGFHLAEPSLSPPW